MKVQDQLRKSLLNFPMLFPNALSVYDHLFCVIGNGYEWKDGELVHSGEENKRFSNMTVKDAVLALLQEALVDDWKDETSTVRQFAKAYEPLDDLSNYIARHGENVVENVKGIFDVENRIKDFSIPTFKGLKFYNGEFKFYPISKYSAICNIPDDIKPDWLQAIIQFIDIMVANPDRVDDPECLFPEVKERVRELYDKLHNTVTWYGGDRWEILEVIPEEVSAGCHSFYVDTFKCKNLKNGQVKTFDESDVKRLI